MDYFVFGKYAIVIAALLMAGTELYQALKMGGSWVKWGLGLVAIVWAAFYVYSIYDDFHPGSFMDFRSQQLFVRSMILITLALVASGAFMTIRAMRRFK